MLTTSNLTGLAGAVHLIRLRRSPSHRPQFPILRNPSQTLEEREATVLAQNTKLTEQLQQSKQKVSLVEREVDVLMKRISQLIRKLAKVIRMDEKLALETEIDALQKKVNAIHADTFASSSERAEGDKPDKEKKKRKPGTGHGPRK